MDQGLSRADRDNGIRRMEKSKVGDLRLESDKKMIRAAHAKEKQRM
jgi:hypothetical protein